MYVPKDIKAVLAWSWTTEEISVWHIYTNLSILSDACKIQLASFLFSICIHLKYFETWSSYSNIYNIVIYYIDRCKIMGIYPWNKFWYLTCEISVFFPPELLLHNCKCGGYVLCCVTVNTHLIVNWKIPRNVIDDFGK